MAEQCVIDSCIKNQRSKKLGLCEKHYYRLRRTGDPMKISRREPIFGSVELRFKSRIKYTESCWLWDGTIDQHGYGFLMSYGKLIKAHRYSYSLHYGEIPNKLSVCHHCDVKHCVNPYHLFLGTQKDNMQDAMRKGRHSCQKSKEKIK